MRIDFYHCDDWVGFYINGKLIREGHSIPTDEIVDALLPYLPEDTQFTINWDMDDFMEELGYRFPSTIEEIDEAVKNVESRSIE